MKTLITTYLFIAGSLLAVNTSASDYRIVSDCIMDGDRLIKSLKDLEKENPRLKGLLIDDSQVAEIREAETECAKKTPEEKVALKQKWDNELSARYGLKSLPQSPAHNDGSYSMPDAFRPGGMFNPIHVDVR